MWNKKLSSLVTGIVFTLLLLGFAKGALASAPASSAAEAKEILSLHIDRVIDLLKSPEFTAPATRNNQIEKINAEILDVFDFEEFSARTIGKKWLGFTPEQQKEFINAFSDLLSATYLEKMDKYDGQKVNYTGSRTSSDGKKVEIQTTVDSSGKEIPVFYQMLNKQLHNNPWVVYDVKIEGMSLVENYRSQFSDIFKQGGNADQLIARVHELAANLRRQNEKITK